MSFETSVLYVQYIFQVLHWNQTDYIYHQQVFICIGDVCCIWKLLLGCLLTSSVFFVIELIFVFCAIFIHILFSIYSSYVKLLVFYFIFWNILRYKLTYHCYCFGGRLDEGDNLDKKNYSYPL